MPKKQRLTSLEQGTIVIDPVLGVWGSVVKNRETRGIANGVVREVCIRLAERFWADLGPGATRRLWYRLRDIRVAGVYAVVMPAEYLRAVRKPGPDARMREGVALVGKVGERDDHIAKLFAVDPKDAVFLSVREVRARNGLPRQEEAAAPERHVEYDAPAQQPFQGGECAA